MEWVQLWSMWKKGLWRLRRVSMGWSSWMGGLRICSLHTLLDALIFGALLMTLSSLT